MPALPNLLLRPCFCRIWAIQEATPTLDPKWHLVYVFLHSQEVFGSSTEPPHRTAVRGTGSGNLTFLFVLFGLKKCDLEIPFCLMTYVLTSNVQLFLALRNDTLVEICMWKVDTTVETTSGV